jgi:hypothetical protein
MDASQQALLAAQAMQNAAAQNQVQIVEDFFVYAVPVFAVNFGQSQTNNVLIQADSDFVLEQISYSANIANAAFTVNSRPIPNVTVLMTDTGSGRQLMSSAIPLPTIAGTGEEPFELPRPKAFVARSTIAVQVSNYDAAVNYNIYISLIGRKLFRIGG